MRNLLVALSFITSTTYLYAQVEVVEDEETIIETVIYSSETSNDEEIVEIEEVSTCKKPTNWAALTTDQTKERLKSIFEEVKSIKIKSSKSNESFTHKVDNIKVGPFILMTLDDKTFITTIQPSVDIVKIVNNNQNSNPDIFIDRSTQTVKDIRLRRNLNNPESYRLKPIEYRGYNIIELVFSEYSTCQNDAVKGLNALSKI